MQQLKMFFSNENFIPLDEFSTIVILLYWAIFATKIAIDAFRYAYTLKSLEQSPYTAISEGLYYMTIHCAMCMGLLMIAAYIRLSQ